MKKKEVQKKNTFKSKKKTSKNRRARKKKSFFSLFLKKLEKFYKKKKSLISSYLKKWKKKKRNKKKKGFLSSISIPKYLPIIAGTVLLFVVAFCMNPDGLDISSPNVVVDPVPVSENTLPGIDLLSLQETYHNSEIIGYIEIPGVISYPIVKAVNNTYYLNHLLDLTENIKGSPFMDYRVQFEDRKILIYGHSGKEQDLPFLQLHRYEDVSFYQEHPTIYLYSVDKIYTYQIFASYLEGQDYDYVNINSFRGLSWLEHIQKLQSKSDYSIPITLDENSKILILQTCNVEEDYIGGTYRLLIGVLTNEEKNHF